jgi:MFS transporter, PAT family, beta-lactamase induction signal transducer AmpG
MERKMENPTTDTRGKRRFPWLYVPTTYFAEGLPYIIVNTASVIMYKKMGVSNVLIGLTSFLYLPWVVKPLWGPTVDLFSTKRNWILATQLTMTIALALLGAVMHLPAFFGLSLVLLTVIAITSATHDIATDGFYMLALPEDKQAFYVGIRSTFYRLAMIFGSGVLVVLAGKIETKTDNIPLSWTTVMLVAAAILGGLFLFHSFYLPRPAADHRATRATAQHSAPFLEAFKAYFQQEGIIPIIAYVVLYRLGEAMLVKMASPFLLDKAEVGGLALSTETVGLVYGTIGVLSLVVGGIFGGWLIAKVGLRRSLWPMALAINLPDFVYVYMAYMKPTLPAIYALVGIEQLGYGIGFAAFMVFLMYTAKGEFKTSHFAISTGIMALGMMLPGLLSGYLQEALGYGKFFITVCLATIPGMITIFFLPLKDKKESVGQA